METALKRQVEGVVHPELSPLSAPVLVLAWPYPSLFFVVTGWIVSSQSHTVKSQLPVPQNVTVFGNRASREVCTCVLSHFSRLRFFVILWTTVCQAPLSLGFSRQEYWSGLPCPPSGDLPDPGVKSEPPGKPMAFLFHSGIQVIWWGPSTWAIYFIF